LIWPAKFQTVFTRVAAAGCKSSRSPLYQAAASRKGWHWRRHKDGSGQSHSLRSLQGEEAPFPAWESLCNTA
jgi:hypothetical protein